MLLVLCDVGLIHRQIVGFSVLVSQMLHGECSHSECRQCYSDVSSNASTFYLWTDGTYLNQSEAEAACQKRNNSFLVRVTNDKVQSTLREFRSAANHLLRHEGLWIDARAVEQDNFHWIEGSSLAGSFILLLYCAITRTSM